MAASFRWLKIRTREFQFYKIGPFNILTENIIYVKVGLNLSESKIERGPVFGMIKNLVPNNNVHNEGSKFWLWMQAVPLPSHTHFKRL